MCNVCQGVGRYTHSPYPGLITFEFCSCTNHTHGSDKLEQQMQILDKNIEKFERELSYGGETLDTGGSGIS